jgi:glycerophosphoryl diester phosphodiesterase
MPASFDLQGHRGARGLRPENTLPSFEAALDVGVTSIETDLHLTRDGTPVIVHDARVSERLCRVIAGHDAPHPANGPLISSLTLTQLRCYRADRNPDPQRFLTQDAAETPLARSFAGQHHIDPYTPPTLADLFAFAQAYAGEPGRSAGKSVEKRERAGRVRFDLEIKRVPYRPEFIGDPFDGKAPGLLERKTIEAIRVAGMIERTSVRSFDHRSVAAVRALAPDMPTAVLVADTAPLSPVPWARQAGASAYCPGLEFVDELLIRQAHAEGILVIPWTVNEPEDWSRLLAWGVDGITTDYPDRLAEFLRERGISF